MKSDRMERDSSLLYVYLPLEKFFACLARTGEEGTLRLELTRLAHLVPERDYQYGLDVLREAIGRYESLRGIPPEASKRAMPFFRDHSRQLVGPELGMYVLPLFENPGYAPEADEPVVRVALDYELLADYCLSNDYSLFRRKYDRALCLDHFLKRLAREYDKVFFDEEHTGFAADSRFFSLLANACLEVADPAGAAWREWRLVAFRRPEEVAYRYERAMIWPYVELPLPVACLRGVCLLEGERQPLLRGTLVGFLRRAGLPAEQLLGLT